MCKEVWDRKGQRRLVVFGDTSAKERRTMTKYIASIAGLALAVAFVVVFSFGHADSKELSEVAPKVGISYDDLMAMGPRVATQTGVTLGTSRHVVFLLACSGQAT